ncbi:hypothetical protein BDY19DRAFT_907807 [Irpex rosettiformis]|uniref:Uncharacterized protein n=1 Tax=Irpex rosettiformis TaxID=378272 RepID=A0ACB8TY34_9APHY|nr:hypothetical protein BDY19DRAFT_907807 [Irpex rosettiformis]
MSSRSASGTPMPQATSGYASPAPSASSPSTTSSSKPNVPKTKPANVFSNDGSFLERFQHLKKDEEEKKKQEETLQRKREFDSRFKRRGKRPAPDSTNSDTSTENPAKKSKGEEPPLTKYQQELQNYAGKSLKDDGIGVRPLVK